MCEAVSRNPPNSAAASGSAPYDVPRISPFASGSVPGGASLGTLASRAGRKNSEMHSWTKAIAYNRPIPTNGTAAISPARSTSQVTMIVRRFNRSAAKPPTGAAKIGGTNRRIRTSATAVWLWVRANAAAMNASVATQSPSEETACPIRRRRNGGARRTAPNPPPPPFVPVST